MLKRLTLGLAAAAALGLAAVPAQAGNAPHGYWHYHGPYAPYYAYTVPKQKKAYRSHRNYRKRQHAAKIRKDCRMFAFGPWRYHPDYRHCKYY